MGCLASISEGPRSPAVAQKRAAINISCMLVWATCCFTWIWLRSPRWRRRYSPVHAAPHASAHPSLAHPERGCATGHHNEWEHRPTLIRLPLSLGQSLPKHRWLLLVGQARHLPETALVPTTHHAC